MRLIDANEIEELFYNQIKYGATDLMGAFDDALADALTVYAVEVVHGRWKKANNRPKSYIRVCSVCGKEAYFCGKGCSYKYCPNCGAKMDGGEE